MRRTLCLSVPLAGLLMAVPSPAAAQSPQTPPPPPNVASPRVPDSKMSVDSAPVTLTGCLERAAGPQAQTPPASRTGTTPATGTAVTGASAPFVLRTAPKAGTQATVYHLFPSNDSVKLSDHVGHRVEVTAALKAATNSQAGMTNAGVSPSVPGGSTGMETMPTASPSTGAATAPAAPGAAVAQPMFVTAVKMLEGSCQAPAR